MLALLVASWLPARPQTPAEDSRAYKIEREEEEYRPVLAADTSIFLRPVVWVDDIWARRVEYALSFVANGRRGADYRWQRTTLDGLGIDSRAAALLRSLRIEPRYAAGMAASYSGAGGMASAEEYSLVDDVPLDEHRLTAEVSGCGYLGGLRYHSTRNMPHGWTLSSYVAARMGRDAYIDGVFTNRADIALRAAKYTSGGDMWSLALLAPLSMRGLRSASTEEAFALTGDNLYNPSWGMQAGKVRNARVRRQAMPQAIAAVTHSLSPSTVMTASLRAAVGWSNYSAPAWFDARTPQPDNYRSLPSYFDDEAVAAAVADAWRSGDERYTQIDWQELYAVNALRTDGSAAYAVEDRVDRTAEVSAAVRFETLAVERLTLRYGITAGYDRRRSFKRMRDLLGADMIVDRDYFLLDDDTYGNMLQNDLRHPDRTVHRGDRFGYDYALTESRVGVTARADWRCGRSQIVVALELSDCRVRRRGYYEKELFAGAASYGRSKTLTFTPYVAKVAWSYAPALRHSLSVDLAVEGYVPEAADLFLQTQYNNRPVDRPRMGVRYGAEAVYRFHSPVLDLEAAAYLLHSVRESRVMHAYDDLSGVYADIVVSDIGRLHAGIEAAATLRYSRRLVSTFALAAGSYRFSGDPTVKVYSDADNTVVSQSRSYMGGCHAGAPELTAYADLAWWSAKGWSLRLSAQYAGLRYVEPSPARRTERVITYADSDEQRAAFARQQRLGDAVTLDAMAAKSFRVGGSQMRVMLSVRNLLSSRDIVYGGYESNRVRRYTVGDRSLCRPFDDMLTYAYPRTYYLAVSWSF